MYMRRTAQAKSGIKSIKERTKQIFSALTTSSFSHRKKNRALPPSKGIIGIKFTIAMAKLQLIKKVIPSM